MSKKIKCSTVTAIIVFVLWLSIGIQPSVARENQAVRIADVHFGSARIHINPRFAFQSLDLSISAPDGKVFQETFMSSGSISYSLPGPVIDGAYTYELRFGFVQEQQVRRKDTPSIGNERNRGERAHVQSGHFTVQGGSIIQSGASEPNFIASIQDQVINDDMIVTGSLAVGFDSVNGESFGFDTIKLKENNLRLYFQDTSTGAFPSNDWRLIANSTTSGGASFFAIEDATAGAMTFKIEAGAPANALYVDDYGRIGVNTSTPATELHVKDSDTPTLRLHQDGSGGWTPQTWDIAGNETNFFIRDTTHGSKLSFRIQPGTPSSTLCMRSSGRVGIGTWSPSANLELEGTGSNVIFLIDRTDGAKIYFAAKSNQINLGSFTNHPVKFSIAAAIKMTLETNGSLTMANGASCTAGGIWTDASSRDLKSNVRDLTGSEALEAFSTLNPVKFQFKSGEKEEHVGFIAEDVPDLVASEGRKGLSPMDIVAVLTKVVQKQQQTIQALQERIAKLEKE